MPSAANPKSEKPASSEAADNTPVRQVMTIIEHKIRNLEKRKSKLTSYRDLQKSGKELNSDQKVAVAKYDEVVQTLEFARDLSKQIASIAVSTEREAKKQAKRDTWIRYAADTKKIREVLLILDCLMQMGNTEARDDFLNGTNGAAKLTEEDLKILDDLYPEVTPKHEVNEEGQAGFPGQTTKAAEHLYSIIDGKPKEILGTTYAHIKEIIMTVHSCGYFDKAADAAAPSAGEEASAAAEPQDEPAAPAPAALAFAALPPPPAPQGLPAPAYPLRPLPPITLQEVEHAYFAQQYPQQRPIAEVIGSQNFFFLQDSEIDSPVGTPQPPMMNQPSPPGPIPTQTFTNQHYVPMPEPGPLPMPPPHFQAPYVSLAAPLPPPPQLAPAPQSPPRPQPAPAPADDAEPPTPDDERNDDEWKETRSPERDDTAERKTQPQGDGQNRFRRYGGRGGGRGAANGYRGRGGFRQGDGYQSRHTGDYQPRAHKDGYQPRQYSDGYQRHGRGASDGYYGNGDAGDHQNENGARERYNNNDASYGGGFKSRGRGGPRGSRASPRAPRPQYPRNKQEHVE